MLHNANLCPGIATVSSAMEPECKAWLQAHPVSVEMGDTTSFAAAAGIVGSA